MISIPSEHLINELRAQINQFVYDAALARAHVAALMARVAELEGQAKELTLKAEPDAETGN